MCTVSWLPAAGGYVLCFNRDERRTRGPALPPARRDAGGMPYLAPLDSDHGGSWLAVNAAGLTLGLLNRYHGAARPPQEPVRSRGLLLLDLIAQPGAAQVRAALDPAVLARTAPFTLVALEPGGVPQVSAWDGDTVRHTEAPTPGLACTSSAVTEPEVAEARRVLFREARPASGEALAALHRSHLPERGRRSVCMHRDDAETRSFSQVTVAPDRVTLLHVPDAPCRGTPLPPLDLERRALPCPVTE